MFQRPTFERIFEPFFRVAEARDRDSGGTGLGLAITSRIVTLYGGHVKARNASEGGLRVEIRLPAKSGYHPLFPSSPPSAADLQVVVPGRLSQKKLA